MKLTGKSSIFQRFFWAYLSVGAITILIATFVNYKNQRQYIEHDIKMQIVQNLENSVGYFEKLFNNPIKEDLKLLASSPYLDELLMSQDNEVLLTQPNAEKFFLIFTKSNNERYLSGRFIDAQGRERVITSGNKRLKSTFFLFQPRNNVLENKIHDLYQNLKSKPLGTILFEGPFEYEHKQTFLAGVAKMEPEIGGFGGVIIFHCDLSGFFRYLSSIKFNEMPMIWIYSPKANLLYSPPDSALLQQTMNLPFFKNIASPNKETRLIRVGTQNQILMRIEGFIPPFMFDKEFNKALVNSVAVAIPIIFLTAIASFILSQMITQPIKKLLMGTQRIALGDLSSKVDIASDDEIGQLTQSFNEMVESLRQSKEQLHYEAFHDVLTKLPNRALLLDRLERLIERAKRTEGYNFAVLFIDLDRFKLVNDGLGHAKGDLLLIEIGQRFFKCLRTLDTVARLGGDEFIILMDDIGHSYDAIHLADRLQKALKPPFNIEGQEIYITASIGICFNNTKNIHPADYLRDTDIAMYRAKSMGKATYQIFDDTMHTHAVNSLQIESDLRNAIEEKQFILHYQPIFSMKDNKITRLEALIRWQHPTRGLVQPLEFISIAEETGMILQIGQWVMENVCRQIRQWHDQGLPIVQIMINFSARQFAQKGLITTIKNTLTEYKIDPKLIGIEITESVAMENLALSIATLNELHSLGIHISIDDFGIGYSSLSSLKLFPINHLKIDRTFVHDLTENPDRAAIAKAIVVMSHSLGFIVVAEGVEKESQLDLLRRYDCDEVQGYLLSHPLTPENVSKLFIYK